MKWTTRVFKDIMTPDDQSKSWYGWASNQLSHAFFGAFIASFAGAYWLLFTLVIASIKEGFDLYKSFNRKTLIDSFADILFWIAGGGIIAGEEYKWVFVVGLVTLLISGMYIRVKENKK